MKFIIGVLLIGLFASVCTGDYQSAFTSFSGFDSITLANAAGDAIYYLVNSVESLIDNYRDFMKSNKIVVLFKSFLPPELPPSSIPLMLGGGLVGLIGYGTWRQIK